MINKNKSLILADFRQSMKKSVWRSPESTRIWRILGQIFILDLALFASSTFQSAPTDSGLSSEVQEVSFSKTQLVEC